MMTIAWAMGKSSVMVRSMRASWPSGVRLGKRVERAAGQLKRRPAGGQINDAHVAPEHALPEAGAQSLGASLFGGEALGVRGGAGRPAVGFPALDIGEHAGQKSVAVSLDGPLHAPDVDDVVAEADDHHVLAARRSFRVALPQGNSRLVHGGAHAPHALAEADEERLANQEVADIQLDKLWDGRHVADIIKIEAVSGMDLEAERRPPGARRLDNRASSRLQRRAHTLGGRLAIGAGVQLDRRRLRPRARHRSGLDPER